MDRFVLRQATLRVCLFVAFSSPTACTEQPARQAAVSPPLTGRERQESPPPRQNASPQKPHAPLAPRPYENLTDELNQRFIAAMHAAVAAPTSAWDEGGLTGLYLLERDFGIEANAPQIAGQVIRSGKPLPRLIRSDPRGLASEKLLEKKVDFAWLRRNVKVDLPFPLSETALLIIAAQSAVSACRADEADYNAKLLQHLDTLPWPAETEWIRYGMYAGFVLHDCIDEDIARRQTQPLVKPLIKWLAAPRPVDLKAYVLFALAASKRLNEVPAGIVLSFVRSQNPDGTWRSGKMELPGANQAPLGAYVIASMLRASSLPLPQTDFRMSSQLPVNVALPLTSQGGGVQ